MKNNPYTLVFGKEPLEVIPRLTEKNELIEAFLNDPPNQQIYMITGVRGCGKTVFMTEISKELRENDEWESIELSTSQNLLVTMAQILSKDKRFVKILKQVGGISVAGFGIQLNESADSANSQIVIQEILEKFKKRNKKLLVCIDEVVSNEYMKEFASVFQILLREDLPIYLIMTGLYDNINDLRNEKNLTFLYRAPEIKLRALNIGSIAENYEKNLEISQKEAMEMANLTKGYSFAFQVLGYFVFRHNGNYKDALSEYRQYLEDYVYDKLWSELSGGDRKLLYGIAVSEKGKAKDIKEIIGWDNNQYTPYRDRLIKKMVVDGDRYGYLKITLPLFEEYVKRRSI
ncbi:MAG: AAA family ATPase [Lachnospiraceae bacterium]|nr:AAA family ATPase [Lachnospiraceae bacterium]